MSTILLQRVTGLIFIIGFIALAFITPLYAKDPPPPNPDPNPGISAVNVLGQDDFTGSEQNKGQLGVISADSLFSPKDVHVANGKLYVADAENNRVLIYNTTTITNGMNADVVLGQTDFTSGDANQGGFGTTASSTSLYNPSAVFATADKLFVADRQNHRIMIWNTASPATNQAADIVLGQADFDYHGENRGGTAASNTLYSPDEVFVYGSKLYVSDSSNHRLLIWNDLNFTDGEPADVVVGQYNFTTTEAVSSPSNEARLYNPSGIFVDANRMYVADRYNRRVLIWDTNSPSTGASSTIVLGQADFVSNENETNATTTGYVADVLVYEDTLYVIDSEEKYRILVWENVSEVSSGAAADNIIGHGVFTDNNQYDTSSTTIHASEGGLAMLSGALYVADTSWHRVLTFNTVDLQGGGGGGEDAGDAVPEMEFYLLMLVLFGGFYYIHRQSQVEQFSA